MLCVFFFFKQKTAYEMRISDWSSDVCSSDLDDPSGIVCPAFAHRSNHLPACGHRVLAGPVAERGQHFGYEIGDRIDEENHQGIVRRPSREAVELGGRADSLEMVGR